MTVAEKLTRAKADIDAVYEAGKSQGGNVDEAFEAGKAFAERERFEILQKGGTNTEYREMFAGRGWTNDDFKPIYDMVPIYCSRMFAFSGITNLKALLEKQGVTLDLRNVATNQLIQMFTSSLITDIGILDVSNTAHLHNFFQDAAQLVNVEKVILSSEGNQTFTQAFGQCRSLVEIRFEGVIGQSISFQQSSKLSADSLESIVTHLSSTSTGQTITLPSTARSNYDAVKGEGAWNTLITPITNWTFAYT